MAVAEEFVALLGYKLKDSGDLKRWQSSLNKAEASAKRTASTVGRLGDGARIASVGVGKLGAALGFVGVGVSAKEGLINFAKFERSMSRIGITAGVSAKDASAAGDTIRDLASKFAMPVDQVREGLDVLVASGMNLREAMSFLPSVTMVAQASGATVTDIGNTAQKAGSSFGLLAQDMDQAFDTMVSGGKLGQFELKDMARYLPTLSAQFAALGYKGQDGLRRLVALLQTARIQTGTAEEAARNAENLFGKIYSQETSKKMKKMGVDVRKELDAASKSEKDLVETFVELVDRATKGDTTKLALLFEDTQVRKMMIALMQLKGVWKNTYEALDYGKVKGSTKKDVDVILADTQSSIDRIDNARDRLAKAAASLYVAPAAAAMNSVSSGLERAGWADKIRQKRGEPLWSRVLNHGANADEIIAEDQAANAAQDRRRRLSAVRRPARAGGVQPAISQGVGSRVIDAFASFTGGSPGVAAGSRDAALGFLRSGMEVPVRADVSSFLADVSGVQGVMRDLAAGVTAKLSIDASEAWTEIQNLRRAMQGISGGASGSWGGSGLPPTPARVVGAGSAP